MPHPRPIKAVRIMCDWENEPVWDAPSVPGASMDGFRVSHALWARMLRWHGWWSTHNAQFDAPLEAQPGFDFKGFQIEGYMIARAVKAELPDWIVIYSDESLYGYGRLGTPGQRPFDVEIPARPH